jgi:hypothetical protein
MGWVDMNIPLSDGAVEGGGSAGHKAKNPRSMTTEGWCREPIFWAFSYNGPWPPPEGSANT